jgi:enoyl-CoA hydratase
MTFVHTEIRDRIAHVTIDHGKANTLSSEVVAALDAALVAAEEAGAETVGAMLITGKPGFLSGGFDLDEIKASPESAARLVTAGGTLFTCMYGSPVPIVVACPGHAIAAGALMLLAADERIGTAGKFKIGLIETQIGMVLPRWAVELGQERLSKRHEQLATVGGRSYDPVGARDAGFLDDVVEPDALADRALEAATYWANLPRPAYAGQVKMLRAQRLGQLHAALESDRQHGISINAS